MALLVHVIIALASIVYTTVLLVRPSKQKFYTSYGLIGATLVSGTYLVWVTHSPLLPSCEAGLAYLAVVLSGVLVAHRRFATVKVRK